MPVSYLSFLSPMRNRMCMVSKLRLFHASFMGFIPILIPRPMPPIEYAKNIVPTTALQGVGFIGLVHDEAGADRQR